MTENESSLFRKSSLERISSPEQLNEYIKITDPSLITILIGIFTLLIAGGIWLFSGGIPKTVDLQGVVATNIEGERKLYCYVPISMSKRISNGMKVQISPDYASREEYGYINGVVTNVSKDIVTSDSLMSEFGDAQVVINNVKNAMTTYGNVVEVEVALGDWSNEKGKNVDVTDGSDCSASVIVGETKAIDFIIKK